MESKRGASIVEVMVSFAILAIGVFAFASIQAFFASDTKNRFVYGCLVSSASNALTYCMSGQTVPDSIKCGGIQVGVNVSGSCNPSGGCNPVTATASYNGISYKESENVCPF